MNILRPSFSVKRSCGFASHLLQVSGAAIFIKQEFRSAPPDTPESFVLTGILTSAAPFFFLYREALR